MINRSGALIVMLMVSMTCFSAELEPGSSVTERQRVLTEITERLAPVMGTDWQLTWETAQKDLLQAESQADFYSKLRRLFAESGKSHLMIAAPRNTPLDQFSGTGYTGLSLRFIGDRVVVTRVDKGSPAGRLGIKPGATIDSIDGTVISPILQKMLIPDDTHRRRSDIAWRLVTWLAGNPGRAIELKFSDAEGKEGESTLVLSEPPGKVVQWGHMAPQPLGFEAMHLGNAKVGYIRFNIFLLELLPEIRRAVHGFSTCDGIIIDLRGNPGGLGLMACPIAGLFCKDRMSLGESHNGNNSIRFPVYPDAKPFGGKLIFLTDEKTASTSEILVGGLQESGRAKVVGHQTMGAVLPSIFIQLPGGAKIQHPIGDFKTPKGISWEGKGVTPDHQLKLTRESFMTGVDPVLEKAVQLITLEESK